MSIIRKWKSQSKHFTKRTASTLVQMHPDKEKYFAEINCHFQWSGKKENMLAIEYNGTTRVVDLYCSKMLNEIFNKRDKEEMEKENIQKKRNGKKLR
jgi:hypothetical protein